MKTMRTFLAVVIAGFIAGGAMASGNLRVNMASGSKELAAVEISNVKMSTFEIDVKDDRGEVVFYKETKAPSTTYKRNYDFSSLNDGTYFFTVRIDNESIATKFNIERGKVNVLEEKKMVDPVFVFDNKRLKLSYLNFAGENTTINVYDGYRTQLYEKDLKSDFVTQYGLDFSKAGRGTYEVVLSSGNDIYSYNVSIN